ncbi:Nif3-like dinuclear metal center hexameric protein [Orbaceae bacterium ac157xtp]
MNNKELERILNRLLETEKFRDYAPNGLQVEGKPSINKIVTGVTACQKLIDAAIKINADAIIVHHGYFWKNEPVSITDIKYKRIKSLIKNDINLYAYHLPLDAHSTLGNNIQIANRLNIEVDPRSNLTDLLFFGTLLQPMTAKQFADFIQTKLAHPILTSFDNAPEVIKRVAWCSGGGQDFIEQAAQLGFDAFITGEVSERTIHIAREYGINFYAAGHHATERYGIKALGEWITQRYNIEVEFIDIDNPA